MMGSNEFSMTSVKLELTIKRLNHMINASRSSYFHSTDYHYTLLGVIDRLWESSGIVLMIDDPRRVELKLFQHIERSFDDIMMEIIIFFTTK